jgi:hypothetical protein
MGFQKYTIYKYVRTDRGWRYCRPAFASNNKIKPNVDAEGYGHLGRGGQADLRGWASRDERPSITGW